MAVGAFWDAFGVLGGPWGSGLGHFRVARAARACAWTELVQCAVKMRIQKIEKEQNI